MVEKKSTVAGKMSCNFIVLSQKQILNQLISAVKLIIENRNLKREAHNFFN